MLRFGAEIGQYKYRQHSMRVYFFAVSVAFSIFTSCSEEREHIAPAIHDRDSVSVMTSYGVNTLISDSGVIKYRIVTERWDVNQVRKPSRWTFIKGLFLEQFDEKFHVQAYIQADTAWYYDQKKLWELRGRVSVRNIKGLIFRGEELFWDGITHELYSYKYSRLITPERTLEGTYFRSDERMTHYTVSNSKGSFVKSDMDSDSETPKDSVGNGDSVQTSMPVRPVAVPRAAQKNVGGRE